MLILSSAAKFAMSRLRDLDTAGAEGALEEECKDVRSNLRGGGGGLSRRGVRSRSLGSIFRSKIEANSQNKKHRKP
jgi:hypothetical protein